MPAPSPSIGAVLEKALRKLGATIRAHRKRLRISAAATAEAAGMSRVTLHRIERGEASVSMGAYFSAVSALGLRLELADPSRPKPDSSRKPPSAIRLAKYPQLKRLAWQLKDTKEIKPEEAIELYERNWRHVNPEAMEPGERELLETLLEAFGRERLLV